MTTNEKPASQATAELPKLPGCAPRLHRLKTDPEVYQAVLAGHKTFEIRLNDRDFRIGDELLLMETTFTGEAIRAGAPLQFTGNEMRKRVSHVLSGYGLMPGWVCLSFAGYEAGRASRAQSEWKPIETAPAAGYFLVCDEDGESVRTKLRHDGEWLDVEYPFIEHAPWGDKSVGLDAQRILDSAQRDPLSPMKLRVSDGCPNPNYWCALPPFHATLGETK